MLSTIAIAFGLSTDAFAAALGFGASRERASLAQALLTGAVFGAAAALMPVAGWAAGSAAGAEIAAFDHWIAFVVLGALGIGMLRAAMATPDTGEMKPKRVSFFVLATIALVTSIDALAAGVTLGLLGTSVVVTALVIGAASFALAATGLMLGRMIGAKVGRIAEAVGGVVMIAIGANILISHLGLMPEALASL